MQFIRKHGYGFAVGSCALLTITCFCFMLHMMGRPTTVFDPPQFEATAQLGDPSKIEKMPSDWAVMDDKEMPFAVGISAIPKKLDDETIRVWFHNPADNSSWIQLQIVDQQEKVLGSTGLLKPGSYVETVSGNFKDLSAASDVSMKVIGFEPDLYYSQGSFVLRSRLAD